MATRKTTFISMTGGDGAAGGTVVLGILGLGVGLLAIDHHFSRPGHSAFDKITRKISKTFSGLDHPSPPIAAKGYFTGAAPWANEISTLPAYAQTVIQKAITTETDTHVRSQLASNLAHAGFPQAASAMRASATGTTGEFTGQTMLERTMAPQSFARPVMTQRRPNVARRRY